MNKVNYQLQTDKIINKIQSEGTAPRLLLHSCCAPCSSYTLEYLSDYFEITVFYYNPNISPKEEFEKRFSEQKRLIEALETKNKVSLIKGEYNERDFFDIAKGFENAKEGYERCFRCYRLRLEKTAQTAKKENFDYFCTTLSISPLKNSQKINEIGFETAEKYGVCWLPSDFKKKEGFKRSIELSREYDLYRQDFCGCVYSKRERENRE
ncbi:MAG: epoxyqueuosine reductase QueH [Eubacterium sp.]|nr:epoxyqueuosine reductase QueH [Eubacterium sp.]MBR4240956.1 epoxyqueuosine reductase QueH [Eubacterium sp.]